MKKYYCRKYLYYTNHHVLLHTKAYSISFTIITPNILTSLSHKKAQLSVGIPNTECTNSAVEIGIKDRQDKTHKIGKCCCSNLKICKSCSKLNRGKTYSLPTMKYTLHTSLRSEKKYHELSLKQSKALKNTKK